MNRHYDISIVRLRFLDMLREYVPAAHVDDFNELARQPRSLAVIEMMLNH